MRILIILFAISLISCEKRSDCTCNTTATDGKDYNAELETKYVELTEQECAMLSFDYESGGIKTSTVCSFD